MPEEFVIKAGERARVLHMVSDSIPSRPRFTAEAIGDGPLVGKIEITRGLFGSTTEVHDLSAQNSLVKGFWDANYSVYVTPDTDTKVTFETRHFRAGLFIKILAVIMILGLISASMAMIFANS